MQAIEDMELSLPAGSDTGSDTVSESSESPDTVSDGSGTVSTGRVSNGVLRRARRVRNDEFYTVPDSVSAEMGAYLSWDRDVFRGLRVVCPCDDAGWSSFAVHFASHYAEYGLSGLVCSCYRGGGHGMKWEYVPGDGWRGEELAGDGDFRSGEVTELIWRGDVVVTNPPFSLLGEFLGLVAGLGKKYSVLGNMNAIGYRSVFPRIMRGEMWLGATGNNADMVFRVPEGVPVREEDRRKAMRMGYSGSYTRLGNVCWYTNLEHAARHSVRELRGMSELEGEGAVYRRYDGRDELDVCRGRWIPGDWDGVMGVPVSSLCGLCPEQFEIVGLANHGSDGEWDRFLPVIGGKPMYKRVLVKLRRG